MSTDSPDEFRSYERIAVLLDQFPYGAAYRIAIGYFLVPLSTYFPLSARPGLSLASWFVGVLLALRLVPVVLRKVLPFSQGTLAMWAERRQIAKRYDSYQWRKLVWFGIGLSAYAVSSREFGDAIAAHTAFCVAGGVLGMLAWRQRSRA